MVRPRAGTEGLAREEVDPIVLVLLEKACIPVPCIPVPVTVPSCAWW